MLGRSLVGTFVGLLILLQGGTLFAAQAPKEHPAKADLIADVAAVQPGKPFQVAVRIALKPDWHVYWINPGDAGTPTEVKFNAPAGWKIEPLPFPTPHEFTMPGDVVCYGYSDSVLLMAKITPPADAKGSVELSADAEWLVCNPDMCIPGKGSPKLTIAVSDAGGASEHADLFRKSAEQLPQSVSLPAINTPSASAEHTVGYPWSEPAKNVQVFLAPGRGFIVKGQKVQTDDKSTTVSFTSKAIGKDKKPADMIVLIAYDDAGGVRRSVQFTYPLKP